MATITKGYTFGSTELVTNAKLHTLVDSASISSIVNADIDSSADILENKIKFDDSNGHTHSGASNNGTKVDLSAPNAIGGTTPNDGTFDALVGTTIDGSLGSVTPAAIVGTTLKANTSLELATGATVTGIADEDDMSSDSAVKLSTQQAIKAYVDTKSGLSNVLFCFGRGEAEVGVSANTGTFTGDEQSPVLTSGNAGWYTTETTYHTVLSTKLKKMSTVDTVTIYCYTGSGVASQEGDIQVDIGGQTGTAEIPTTPAWQNFDIDISSLTDGTVYDVSIKLKADTGDNVKLMSIIAFGG